MALRFLTLTSVLFVAGCASRTATTTTTPTERSARAEKAPIEKPQVDKAQIDAAQRAWCEALVAIGAESTRPDGDPVGMANTVLSTAYNYDAGVVLFKPTLTSAPQTFRLDKAGALAYFVGGDPVYPNDAGFARKAFSACEAKVVGVVAHGDMAVAMGNVYLTDSAGKQVIVDKTFGYLRGDDGALRIVLHHSSLPYSPTK